jgi:hypothetical protein
VQALSCPTPPDSLVLKQPEHVAIGSVTVATQAAAPDVAHGLLHRGTGSGHLSQLRLEVRYVLVGHRRGHALRSTARYQPDVLALGLEADVSGKDDLYELMVDEVVDEIHVPEPSGDWQHDLREIARAIHAMLQRHRWMVLLGIRPVIGPKTRRFGEIAPRVFDPLELDAPTRIKILATLNNYLYGFVHREIAWE